MMRDLLTAGGILVGGLALVMLFFFERHRPMPPDVCTVVYTHGAQSITVTWDRETCAAIQEREREPNASGASRQSLRGRG